MAKKKQVETPLQMEGRMVEKRERIVARIVGLGQEMLAKTPHLLKDAKDKLRAVVSQMPMLLAVLLWTLAGAVAAQDGNVVEIDGFGLIVSEITAWLTDPANLQYIATAFFALYELLVRLYPTAQDWSILSWVGRLLHWLVPNRAVLGSMDARGTQLIGGKRVRL